MTRGLYPAAKLESWGVINRVVPDGTVHEKGMKFAHQLAAGPTKAHAATKRIVKAVSDGGIERADRGHAGAVRRPVRDRGSAERGALVPCGRAWESHFRG